jgi:hypothetical protein
MRFVPIIMFVYPCLLPEVLPKSIKFHLFIAERIAKNPHILGYSRYYQNSFVVLGGISNPLVAGSSPAGRAKSFPALFQCKKMK